VPKASASACNLDKSSVDFGITRHRILKKLVYERLGRTLQSEQVVNADMSALSPPECVCLDSSHAHPGVCSLTQPQSLLSLTLTRCGCLYHAPTHTLMLTCATHLYFLPFIRARMPCICVCAGLLRQGHRHLDGSVSPLRLLCAVRVRCGQLCLQAAQRTPPLPATTQEQAEGECGRTPSPNSSYFEYF